MEQRGQGRTEALLLHGGVGEMEGRCFLCVRALSDCRAHNIAHLITQAVNMDVTLLDKKIDQMMPELGFKWVLAAPGWVCAAAVHPWPCMPQSSGSLGFKGPAGHRPCGLLAHGMAHDVKTITRVE